ncbi:MAG TPA: hypothetical protein VHT53_08275 [Candidatus Elarobacter sp.]|nr:hypothetical protein [Candidatus Elarobacter sp.]
MSAARALVALAVAVACAAQSPSAGPSPSPSDASLTPDGILARVKAVFRSYPRPPYVAYTLVRRDRRDGVPDFANSYTLKIWCRTADRSALARRAWHGAAYGDLDNITVMFDREVDPGPPTADMFEKRLFGAPGARRDARAATPVPSGEVSPDPASALTEIGRVAARDGDYRVARTRTEGALLHLWLEPRTDQDRNRLDDLWVDARTYDLRRALVRDHLYFDLGGGSLEDEFDVRFTPGPGNLPVIASIHGQTRGGEYETDYTFQDVTFPPSLPDWYFQPKLYGLHRADAPA